MIRELIEVIRNDLNGWNVLNLNCNLVLTSTLIYTHY